MESGNIPKDTTTSPEERASYREVLTTIEDLEQKDM